MGIYSDVQKLVPGERVELFELDGTEIGFEKLLFHGYVHAGSIIWQGREYRAWPIEADGFARTGEAQQPTPTLRVGNVDGYIAALAIQLDDLIGARLTRRVTLGRYLDAANWRTGNPEADPEAHFPDEIWYINQRTGEAKDVVEFALRTALDLNGMELPNRQIVANLCHWLSLGGYRGAYCGYTGNQYFDADDSSVGDPAQDRCGGRLASCKARFGEGSELPFGSFPGAALIRS